MLETIAIVLVVLWLLGFVSSYTMGGFIHILLVIGCGDTDSSHSRSRLVTPPCGSIQDC